MAPSNEPGRPNVLLVSTDQQFAGALGCAGNPYLDTPAMDHIAARGTRFENAYCPYPLCGPARASMFTGRMPHETGVTENWVELPEEHQSELLGHVLRGAGYTCGYAGKWHVPEVSMPEGNGFEPLSEATDAATADAAAAFLSRDHEDPFFLVASFSNPHDICEWARNQALPEGPIPEASIEECPPLPTNFPPPPFEPQVIREVMATDERLHFEGAMLGATEADWRRYRHAYYRLVERVDAEIGRVLDALADNGLAEETVVIFTSDHGDGNGAHRINQKRWLYEEPTRVPFLVSHPTETSGGAVDDDHLVSLIDLVPTICDYAGVDPPAGLLGRSVRGPAAGETPDWRDRLVVDLDLPMGRRKLASGRMLRTDQYKYVVYSRGRRREQLFDLDADPGEMQDLSNVGAYEGVLENHRTRLAEWCHETGDTFDAIPGVDLNG